MNTVPNCSIYPSMYICLLLLCYYLLNQIIFPCLKDERRAERSNPSEDSFLSVRLIHAHCPSIRPFTSLLFVRHGKDDRETI